MRRVRVEQRTHRRRRCQRDITQVRRSDIQGDGPDREVARDHVHHVDVEVVVFVVGATDRQRHGRVPVAWVAVPVGLSEPRTRPGRRLRSAYQADAKNERPRPPCSAPPRTHSNRPEPAGDQRNPGSGWCARNVRSITEWRPAIFARRGLGQSQGDQWWFVAPGVRSKLEGSCAKTTGRSETTSASTPGHEYSTGTSSPSSVSSRGRHASIESCSPLSASVSSNELVSCATDEMLAFRISGEPTTSISTARWAVLAGSRDLRPECSTGRAYQRRDASSPRRPRGRRLRCP